MTQYIFTPEGYQDLKDLICETKKRLSRATKEKARAGSGQDTWHDEGFKMGVVEEAMISRRLSELEQLYASARVVEPKKQCEKVYLGVRVVIEYEDKSTFKFILDGYVVKESTDRVSVYSPLGKAITGAKKGEKRVMWLGKEKKVITIKKILPPKRSRGR